MKPDQVRPRPSLELVGDWTGPRLLVRLMLAIRSPWEPTERGLRFQKSGEICKIWMGGPDARLLERFREGDNPIAPSLTPEILQAIEGHRSVLRISADPSLTDDAALAAVARCGGALVNAGALAVWCPQSGAAHSADRWLEIAQLLEDEDETEEDLDDDLEDEDFADFGEDLEDFDEDDLSEDEHPLLGLEDPLYTLYVRGLVQRPDRWTTAGMGLLGLPDVAVPPELPDAAALSTLSRISESLRRGQPPTEGETLRASVRLPPGRWTHQVDASSGPMFNPFGVWRLIVP